MDKMMEKKRIGWVDAARGIAILLVMIGHAPQTPYLLSTWLYSFHVPLFFFLSGYVFSCEKYSNFKSFLVTRIQTLLIPLAFFTIIDTAWCFLLNHNSGIQEPILRMIGYFVELRGSKLDSHFWFICCLFVVEIIYWLLWELLKNKNGLLEASLLVQSVIGFGYIRLIGKVIPWAIEASLLAVGFFGIGNLMNDVFRKSMGKWRIAICVLALVLNLVVVFVNLRFGYINDLYANRIAPYFLYYLGAFSGIALAISVSMRLENIEWLQYIGRNSLVYYFLHKTLFASFGKIMEILTVEVDKNSQWFFYVLFSSAALAVIAWSIRRYIPWIFGRFDKRGKK